MTSNTDLLQQERRALCAAFAERLVYPSRYYGGELTWRDSSKRPNLLRPVLYQHPHQDTKRWCPPFTRFEINFSVPWNYRRGFWEAIEALDKSGPNFKIQITVLPDEAAVLARWMPLWLAHRENVLTESLPDPPQGMDGLLLKTRRTVYFWSDAADKAYESWLTEQRELATCH